MNKRAKTIDYRAHAARAEALAAMFPDGTMKTGYLQIAANASAVAALAEKLPAKKKRRPISS